MAMATEHVQQAMRTRCLHYTTKYYSTAPAAAAAVRGEESDNANGEAGDGVGAYAGLCYAMLGYYIIVQPQRHCPCCCCCPGAGGTAGRPRKGFGGGGGTAACCAAPATAAAAMPAWRAAWAASL